MRPLFGRHARIRHVPATDGQGLVKGEPAMPDIALHVKSLLPPELWERYCHLSYAQMAQVHELSEYATELSKADLEWHRERKVRIAAKRNTILTHS